MRLTWIVNKKNAQLRYQISRELDIYKKKKEADGDRYEPVIKSILSAAMSVGTTFLGHIADKTGDCRVFLIPIILLLLLLEIGQIKTILLKYHY